MRWPGTGDPRRRKKTIRFLIILLIIGVAVGVSSSVIQGFLGQSDPLKVCIDDKNTPYKMSITLELYVDGNRATIPANIGFGDSLGDDLLASDCQRTIYTLTDDGTIYAEWEEEYPFEIGHFLWMWDFPLRDMDQNKSTIYVNDRESSHFINHPLQDGYHYKAVFTSKAYDDAKDTDFLPEN